MNSYQSTPKLFPASRIFEELKKLNPNLDNDKTKSDFEKQLAGINLYYWRYLIEDIKNDKIENTEGWWGKDEGTQRLITSFSINKNNNIMVNYLENTGVKWIADNIIYKEAEKLFIATPDEKPGERDINTTETINFLFESNNGLLILPTLFFTQEQDGSLIIKSFLGMKLEKFKVTKENRYYAIFELSFGYSKSNYNTGPFYSKITTNDFPYIDNFDVYSMENEKKFMELMKGSDGMEKLDSSDSSLNIAGQFSLPENKLLENLLKIPQQGQPQQQIPQQGQPQQQIPQQGQPQQQIPQQGQPQQPIPQRGQPQQPIPQGQPQQPIPQQGQPQQPILQPPQQQLTISTQDFLDSAAEGHNKIITHDSIQRIKQTIDNAHQSRQILALKESVSFCFSLPGIVDFYEGELEKLRRIGGVSTTKTTRTTHPEVPPSARKFLRFGNDVTDFLGILTSMYANLRTVEQFDKHAKEYMKWAYKNGYVERIVSEPFVRVAKEIQVDDRRGGKTSLFEMIREATANQPY